MKWPNGFTSLQTQIEAVPPHQALVHECPAGMMSKKSRSLSTLMPFWMSLAWARVHGWPATGMQRGGSTFCCSLSAICFPGFTFYLPYHGVQARPDHGAQAACSHHEIF
jgi:hypothetical protein